MQQAKKNQYHNSKGALKYVSLAIQMITTLVGFTLLGRYLDSVLRTKFPWITLVSAVLGLFSSVYFAIKDLLKK